MKNLIKIVLLIIVFFGGESFANCVSGVNILNDSSFEDENSLNSWNKVSGSANILRANYSTEWAGDAPTNSGSYFLYASGGNEVTVEQTVDVSACIGADNMEYDFSAFLGGYGDGDTIAVKLEFKDENNNTVISYNSGDFTSSKEMTLFTNSDLLSSDIKSATISLTFTKVTGTDIDGYVDAISLIIKESPPPNSSCTLGTNIINGNSFENVDSLNNWSKISGSANLVRGDYSTGWAGDEPSGAGKYFLYASNGDMVTVTQSVNISECMGSDIGYDFSTFLGGYGDGDTIAVKIEFKDKNSNIIESYNSGDFSSSKKMTLFTHSDSLSNNIETMTISLSFKRVNGSDIDGYIDVISLIIRKNTNGADTIKPIITLNGNDRVDLVVGDNYTDKGATAEDNIDGNITDKIVISGDSVDTTTAGTYIIRYNVSDEAGNNADEVNRTVIVKESATYNCTLGTNIISNNSFEDESSLNSWNRVSGTANIIRANYSTGWAGDAPSGAGAYFLYASNGDDITVSQTVDISSCIGGDIKYDFSAFLGGYGDGDTVAVKLEFEDENGTLVTSYDTDDFTSSKEMIQLTHSDLLSNSVHNVIVSLRFKRVTGSDIDGYIDNLSIIIDDAHSPLKITSPKNNYIQTGDNLRVDLNSITLDEGWGIEVILDKNSSNEQIKRVYTLPYSVDFDNIDVGEHVIDAYIIDSNNTIQSGDKKHDFVSNIGIGGDIIVAIGDSITYGYADDDNCDDNSTDGRNSGGGYTPILNNILTQRLNKPHTIYNEGVPGNISEEGLSILPNILDKHPDATKYLVMFGTNDASSWADINRSVYKSNMQQIIDLIKGRGKIPILAKIPRVLGELHSSKSYEEDGVDPEDGFRNINIKKFNIVIQELIEENNITMEAPEFYSYFRDTYGDTYRKNIQDGYADNLHPDGLGYRDMANIWANILDI